MTRNIRSSAVTCLAILSILAGSPSRADDPPPFPVFTFKRQKAPQPGEARQGLVQIKPGQQAILKPQPQPKAEPEEVQPVGDYGWFWEDVPAELAANPVERLRTAFISLEDGPDGDGTAAPRLQHLQDIASENGPDILRATIGSHVSPALVLAVIAVESGGQVQAESPKGAQGLMQLMPDTATRFGVTDSLSAQDNIKGGVAYLSWLLDEFDGDAVLALAGYNAGEGAVRRHGGVPPYPETRDYVPKVLAAYDVARRLCQTQPQLITDACALRLASN